MDWLRDPTFWEEAVQWILLGYLLVRRRAPQVWVKLPGRTETPADAIKPRDWDTPL